MTFEEALKIFREALPTSYILKASEYDKVFLFQAAPISLRNTKRAAELLDSVIAVYKDSGRAMGWNPMVSDIGKKIRDIDPDPINGEWFAGILVG